TLSARKAPPSAYSPSLGQPASPEMARSPGAGVASVASSAASIASPAPTSGHVFTPFKIGPRTLYHHRYNLTARRDSTLFQGIATHAVQGKHRDSVPRQRWDADGRPDAPVLAAVCLQLGAHRGRRPGPRPHARRGPDRLPRHKRHARLHREQLPP